MQNISKKALLFVTMLVMVCIVGACTSDKINVSTQPKGEEIPVEDTVNQEEKEQVPLVLYYGNEMLDGLIAEEVMVDNKSAEVIIDLLSNHNIVSKDTRVVHFTMEEKDGKNILYLDLSKQFKDYMGLVVESGEYVVMGALTNTFLDAFESDGILITIEGVTLETPTHVYNTYLTEYPLEKEQEYTIKERSLETEIIKIKYPQITGMSNRELEAKFNTSLMRVALEYEGDGLTDYKLSYEVATSNDKLISIIYRGSVNYDGAAHPFNYALTFNFDITGEKEIRLKDYIDPKSLKEMFDAGEYTILSEIDEEEVQSFLEMTYSETNTITFEDFDYNLEDKTFIAPGYSYVKNNHLVVVIEVNHALGDYIEIEFNQKLN